VKLGLAGGENTPVKPGPSSGRELSFRSFPHISLSRGLSLTPGYHQIPQNRKTVILQIPLHKIKRDILLFLGLNGYFRI
jgi:hypothetical protein